MKCQTLFSGKNKKNIINLSSAENAQRVVKVKPIVASTTYWKSLSSIFDISGYVIKIFLEKNG